MNLTKLNNIAYKVICIAICAFIALVSISLLVMHFYLRSVVGFAFVAILAYQATKSASVKAWIITVILSALGIAAIDLYTTKKPEKSLSAYQCNTKLNRQWPLSSVRLITPKIKKPLTYAKGFSILLLRLGSNQRPSD